MLSVVLGSVWLHPGWQGLLLRPRPVHPAAASSAAGSSSTPRPRSATITATLRSGCGLGMRSSRLTYRNSDPFCSCTRRIDRPPSSIECSWCQSAGATAFTNRPAHVRCDNLHHFERYGLLKLLVENKGREMLIRKSTGSNAGLRVLCLLLGGGAIMFDDGFVEISERHPRNWRGLAPLTDIGTPAGPPAGEPLRCGCAGRCSMRPWGRAHDWPEAAYEVAADARSHARNPAPVAGGCDCLRVQDVRDDRASLRNASASAHADRHGPRRGLSIAPSRATRVFDGGRTAVGDPLVRNPASRSAPQPALRLCRGACDRPTTGGEAASTSMPTRCHRERLPPPGFAAAIRLASRCAPGHSGADQANAAAQAPWATCSALGGAYRSSQLARFAAPAYDTN